MDEYFPYCVRERLIRDLIIFNFQSEGQPLRAYIDQVFRAAGFLEYNASEQQLVDMVVMNFHPSILAHAAFFDNPRFLKIVSCGQLNGEVLGRKGTAASREALQPVE